MVEAIFGAADVTGMSTNVQTLLTGFIVIPLGFLAYRLLKRTFSAA